MNLHSLRKSIVFFLTLLLFARRGSSGYVTKAFLPSAVSPLSKLGGSYEYSYDATNLIVKVYTKTEVASTADVTSVAALFPYSAPGGNPDNWYALWCKMSYNSGTN